MDAGIHIVQLAGNSIRSCGKC